MSNAYNKAQKLANKQVANGCIVPNKGIRQFCPSSIGLVTNLGLCCFPPYLRGSHLRGSPAGEWHVIMACRDFLKAERMARKAGISKDDYTTIHLDLSSLESVRQFVDNFRWVGRGDDAVYVRLVLESLTICAQISKFIGRKSSNLPHYPSPPISSTS